ncbi:hypothetical protein Kfla_6617 [Kribbella flavida DSM 17836]|uniref:Uncharacterized protein n=1 Tax=Kribbella flavida (strain DSM 17836 / JCM 10339 / NBRC 14399) TaxID=479435 RepID=D2PZP3_KRIFD|nr:hypothetical protein [Kribbella flavida]ADB35609.1 hypothetical protein Kfla_6617 [Kribbella flavida DSM 17836]
MTRVNELDLLKTLDPAVGDIDPRGLRARADLERILATDTTPPGVGPRRNRRFAPRLALATGLVAATAAAAIALPSVFGGDKAFATWTAAPAAMSEQDSASASAACRTKSAEYSPGHREELATATTALSERRGTWTLVLLAGRNAFAALCINDGSKPSFQSFHGSIGSTLRADRPARREIHPTTFGAGSIDGEFLSVAVGVAGADVTGITYTSPSRGKVTATVSKGQFALWLPGNDFEHAAPRRGVPIQLTYRDGSTTATTLRL